MPTSSLPLAQPRNPLHGKTLQAILTELVAHYGWDGLAQRIALRCFSHEPSISSSLKVLRKTPWARGKVESLYLFMLREQRRAGISGSPAVGTVPHPSTESHQDHVEPPQL